VTRAGITRLVDSPRRYEMRLVAVIVLLAFVVALAVVVGTRLSADALAVVVGVACGVVAGIPMSVLILAALNRRADASLSRGTTAGMPQPTSYPPVVVIQGGAPAPNNLVPPYYPSSVEAAPRRFRIVGEEEQ
jgi:hypothetical protein